MIVTTTDSVEGRTVDRYLGVISGKAIMGANIFKDLSASIRNIVGGRSTAYEKTLHEGEQAAMTDLVARAKEIGANAVVGIDIDYETVGQGGSMLLVCANGTAVKLT